MDKTGPSRPQPIPRPPAAGEKTVAAVTALLDKRAAGDGPALRRLVDAAADGASRLVGRPALVGGLSALGASLLNTGAAVALPDLATVNSGTLTASQPAPGTLTLNQGTRRADATFRSFDIHAGETVNVLQPSAQSTLTARVAPGTAPTTIAGALNANGHVTIINGSGVIFSKGAKIDVGSIVATTATRAVVDPTSGVMTFAGAEADSAVVNEGDITVRDGGFAALVAPTVRNNGTIHARLGKVTLASAQSFTVDPYGDRLVSFEIGTTKTAGKTAGRVDQGGAIHADGGVVVLDAGGLDRMVDGVLNMDGMVRARSVGIENGEVVLGGAAVTVAGTVDVTGSGAGETGGRVTVTGGTATLTDGAVIDASGDAGGGTVSFGGTDGALARLDISDTATVRAAGSGGTADGGVITARTTDSLKIAGDLDVSGGDDGGSIVLQSGGDTTGSGGSSIFLGTARLDGDSGGGGQFSLLGDAVRLDAGATVSATGGSGGGTVRIGGGYRGGEGVRTAKTTVVDENTAIDASATRAGDGGTIIIWSDEVTTVDGSLTARGAGAGGDGGLIETSGKQLLKMTKVRVDAGADDGVVGSWLLDPSLIRVRSGSGSAGLADVSAAGNPNTDGLESIIDVALINAATATVTLAATSGIIFETAVSMANAGAGLIATVDHGYIQIDAGATITTNDGAVTFTANGGDITIGAAIDTNGGAVTLNAGGAIVQNANIETNNGIATLTAGGVITQAAGVGLAVADGTVSMTAGGNITLTSVTSTRSFATVQDAIVIESTGGTIIDGDTTAADLDIKAGANARVKLTAATGIGSGGDAGIETEVGHLSLTSTAGGTIDVANTGSMSLEVSGTGGGWVDVRATGGAAGITIAGAGVVADGDVTISAADSIAVDQDIDLSGGAGRLILDAGAAITQTTGKLIKLGGGALTLTAQTGIGASGAALQVDSGHHGFDLEATTQAGPLAIAQHGAGTMTVRGATIASGAGDLFLRHRGDGDISVTGAVRHDGTGTVELLADRSIDLAADGFGGSGSIGAGGGNVSLKGDHDGDGTGAVLNSGGGTVTMDGGLLTLEAADGIGTAANELKVALSDDVAIDATTVDGGIWLSATGSAHQAKIRTARVTGTAAADIAISHDGTLAIAGSVANQSSGAVTLAGDQAVTFAAAGSITSADGAVTVTSAGGGITMADGARIDAGAGTIDVTAHGNVSLASLKTTNTATTSAVVSVTSHAGGIIDGGGMDPDIEAAGLVALAAATGIGDTDALDTVISTLTLSNSGPGKINLHSGRDLSFSAIQTGTGDVAIMSTGGSLSLDTLFPGSAVGLQAGGRVLLMGKNSVTLNAASDVGGDFNLKSLTGDVTIKKGGTISANGAVRVIAADKIRIDGTTGVKEIDAGKGGSGDIILDGDVILGPVNPVVGAPPVPSTVDLFTTGAITIKKTIDGTTAHNEGLTLSAGGTIQIDGAIGATTNLGTLTIKDAAGVTFASSINAAGITQDAGQAGGTTAFNGAVIVDTGVDLTTAGAVAINADVTAGTGGVTIAAGEAVTLSSTKTVFTTGSVDIRSTGGTVTAHGTINASNQAITLRADGDIDLGPFGLLTTTGTDPGAAVTVTSDAGAITMADGARIDAGAGTIDVTAHGNVTLASLKTTNTATASPVVSVTSHTGSIIDGGDAHLDIEAMGLVALTAATGIGHGNRLETSITSLTLDNSLSGTIDLESDTNLTFSAYQGGHDAVSIESTGGDLTLGTLWSPGTHRAGLDAGGDVTLTAIGMLDLQATSVVDGKFDLSSSMDVQISGNIDMTGGTGMLTAFGGDAVRISHATVTTNGAVDLTGLTDVEITGGGSISANGAVTVTASNKIRIDGAAHGAEIDAGSGAITLNGDVALDSGTVDLAATGAITVNGAIDGATAGTEALTLAAGGAIHFGGTIGATTKLGALTIKDAAGVDFTDTINAASITQDAGQAGGTTAFNGAVVVDTGVDLTTAGAVAINTDVTAGTGGVTIAAGEAVSLGGTKTVFTTGSVDIRSTGGTVTAHGTINASNQAITLRADGDIDLGPLGLLTTTGTDPGAAVTVTSDTGAITMADGAHIDAGAATIGMAAAGDITLGLLTTTATGSAMVPAVAVTSTGGGIIDADTTGGADITATSGAVSLAAATGIGDGNPLEIGAATLTASNNNAGGPTSGAIEIELAQSTVIKGLDQQAAGDGIALTVATGSGADIDIQGSGITAAGTGDVSIEAEGAIRVDAAISHAGSGDVSLGATGGTDIKISAPISTGGSVDIGRGATGTTTLNGLGAHTSLIDAGNKLVLHQNTVLAANTVKLDAGAGGMVFDGTVDGGQALAVEASGAGVIDFRQAVGGTTRLAGLAATAARITSGGGVINTSGAQVYTGDVQFTGSMSVSSTSGDITVDGKLDADQDVTMDAGAGAADVTITGDVGSGTAPDSLDITAATTTLGGSVTTTGLQRYSNAVVLNGGTLQSTGGGTLDFGGAVTLTSAASTIDSHGGDITFASTIDGGQDLTVTAGTGKVDFQDDIGGTTAVGSLDVTARSARARSVTTTGAQTYTGRLELIGSNLRTDGAAITFNDTVFLTGAATIDTTGGGTIPTGGDIAFKGAGTSLSGRGQNLTLNAGSGGDVSIDNKVGPTASCVAGSCKQPLGVLTVTEARDVTFGAAITARQLVVTAHGKMTAKAITTNGNSGVGVDLTADSFDFQGAITTDNPVWAAGQSTSITATGSAGIHFGAAADITHNAGTGAITVTAANGDITMADGAEFNSNGGTITLDARNGDIALGRLITSHAGATAVTLNAVKGRITDAGDTGGADVSTAGGGLVVNTRDGFGTVADPIETEIGRLDANNVGNSGAARGDIAVSNAGYALTVGHLTQDAVNGAVALDTSTAHDITVDVAITTTGTGAVTIDSGAAVHVNHAVQSDDGAITITGATTVETHAGAAIGSGTGAITLTAGGGDLILGDTVTSGGGAITATATNDIAVNAAVSGSGDINLDAGNDLTVDAGVTSTSHTTTDTVTLKAGNTLDINQDVRSHDATITLTGVAALVFDADITATGAGNIEVNSAVTLDGASVVTSTTGDIEFAATVDGAQAFEVQSGSGTATFKGDVGGTTSLASLATAGHADFGANDVTTSGAQQHRGRTTFAGGTVTSTGGALRFDGTVTLGGATTTTLTAASGVTFNTGANITGTTAYAESLSVDGGTGAVSFGAAVGVPVPLAGLEAKTSGTGTITLNDATVGTLDLSTEDGNIALQGAVAIDGPGLSTIKSTGTGSISQSSAVSVAAAATYKLETNGGDIDISGTVDGPGSLVGDAGSGDITGGGIFGGTTKLATVDLSGRIVTVDSVRTTGAQTYRVDPAAGHLKVVGSAKFVGGPITVYGPTLVKTNVLNINPMSDVNLHGGLITLSNPFDVVITNPAGNDVDVNIGGAGVGSAALPFGNLIIDGVDNINIAGSIYVDGTMQLSATFAPDSSINIAAPVTVNGDRATISSVAHRPEYNPDYTALLYAGTPGSGTPAGAVNVQTSGSLTVRGNTLLAGNLDVNNVRLSGSAPGLGRTLTVGGVSGMVFGSIDGVGGRAAAQLASALPGVDLAKLLINSCPVTTVCGLSIPIDTLVTLPPTPVSIQIDKTDLFNVMKYEELHFFDEKKDLYGNYSNTGNAEIW